VVGQLQGVRAKAESVKDGSKLILKVSQTHKAVAKQDAYVFVSQSSDETLVSLLNGDFMHTLHSLRCLPLRSRGCGGLAMQFYIEG
jgi:hypothetical protein